MLQTARKMCMMFPLAIGVLEISTSDAQAQAPPFPEITITEPENNATFQDGTVLHAKGTSSQPNTAFTLVITNRYTSGGGMVVNTHTLQGFTDDGGAWEDSSNITVYGPGTWKVEVYFSANPQITDSRAGNVEGTP